MQLVSPSQVRLDLLKAFDLVLLKHIHKRSLKQFHLEAFKFIMLHARLYLKEQKLWKSPGTIILYILPCSFFLFF